LAATAAPAASVVDRASGYRYEVVFPRDEVWQVETHPDDPQHRIQRRAEYLVGSGNHAVAWLAAENGFLTELPVGWFGQASWRMNPGYELKNHRFSRPIPAGCVGCHSTRAVHEAPTANRFELPIADGIGCSRCHGDADEHVAFWKSAGDKGTNTPPSAQLVHPGRLASERANDLCLQCHLQGDVAVSRGQSSPFDFHAGQNLIDQRHDFLIAGQPATLGVASHGARLLQSRCYTASNRRLTCIHCHDPHRPTSDFAAADYDAKCFVCHQPQSCKRPLRDEHAGSATGCVSCHMQKRPTREGVHLVITDHAIRRRPAALTSVLPPVLATNADAELVSAWPGAKPDPGTLGAAYVLLHETMGPQLPSLARGRQLLTETVAKNPADGDSRYWLGSALLALHRPAEARDELRQVLSEQPTRHEARYRLALAEEAAGNPPGAIAEYTRLLAESPNWPEPYSRLAQLYLSQQQAAEAASVLRRLVSLQPDAAAYASLALAERLAGASHEQTLATVDQAIALDPRQPAAYVNRGTLWLLAGRSSEARTDFERALRLDPANAAARQAMSALTGGK
jgi:Flp pilus assembly protein TadD